MNGLDSYVPSHLSLQFKKISYLSGIILGSRHFKETFVQWQIMSYGILKLKKKTIVGSMNYEKTYSIFKNKIRNLHISMDWNTVSYK